MESNDLSRRTFITGTAAATVAAMTASSAVKAKPTKSSDSASPNERLRLAFIGVGGRAQTHLNSAIKLAGDGKVEVVAVCDVFNRYREEAAHTIENGTKHKPKQIADYREI